MSRGLQRLRCLQGWQGVVFRKDPGSFLTGFQGVSFRFFKSHKMHERNPICVSEQSLWGNGSRVPGVFRGVRVGFQEHSWEVSRRPWSGLQMDFLGTRLLWVPRVTGC